MGAFLSYCIVCGIVLLALYLAYRLFLAGDNQHAFNRIVLLSIYALSFAVAPFCLALCGIDTPSQQHGIDLEEMVISGEAVGAPSRPLWGTVALWVYIGGMTLVTVKTAIVWLRLARVIRRGKKIERTGYTLVVTDNVEYAPFSWLRYIVISAADLEKGCSAIAAHEQKHIACHHWVDLLVAQTVCIVNWFNPAAWLMRDELMLVHEYQADMAVIDGGYNPQEYQMLLIKKAVGARFPSLANSLNHSKLKKRITMMYKAKSGAGSKIKALALVPVLALALGVTGVPVVRAAVTTIGSSEISANKSNENSPDDQITVRRFVVTNVNNDGRQTTVVVRAENLGNIVTVSGGTFTNNGSTYRANGLQTNTTDSLTVIKAVFPFSEEFNRSSMKLIVNGEEIPFELDGFFRDSRSGVVVGTPTPSQDTRTVIVLNGSNSSFPADMEIYLDNERITSEQMRELSPESIASITVDRQNNCIRITSKQ